MYIYIETTLESLDPKENTPWRSIVDFSQAKPNQFSLPLYLISTLLPPPPKPAPRTPPISPPTHLPLRHRPNPTNRDIHSHSNNTNNPNRLPILHSQIPKDNRKDHPSQIPHRARNPAHNPIRMRVHMRHEPKRRSIRRLQEKRQPGNQPHHRRFHMRVGDADRDLEHARQDRKGMEEVFLRPDIALALPHALTRSAHTAVHEIREQASSRAADDVEEAEHGGPAARARLAEFGEVFQVVGAEDGVDGELGAEGAEVAGGSGEGLEGEQDGEEGAEGGFDDDFAAGGVEHCLRG